MSIGETPAAAYPAHFESDVVLRNGRTLHIRPVRPEDRDALLEFYRGMSRDSLYMRFFDVRTPDAALRDSPTVVDYVSDFGVVGEVGGYFAGIAHYFRSRRSPRVAEVAFAIADRAQGCGIGTHLLQKLATIARTHGIDEFRAETLSDNQKMLDVFLCSGFDVKSRSSDGAVHVSFPIAETEEFQDRAAERSQKAAWASMKAIFEPRSVAVIGASRRRGQIGYEILSNLRLTGFRGELFAVNPRAEEIETVPSFPSVTAIPAAVDLAIIAVPAGQVEAVIDDCVTKGVGAVVVITEGFGETGAEGREIEMRMVEKVRAAGIRMVGPNCMGVLNTDPNVNLHATFTSIFPPRAERRARRGHSRLRAHAQHGLLHIHLRRQQGRRFGQRPHSVLGGRPEHGRDASVSGELRQPAKVRRDRPPRRPPQTDRGREVRTIQGGCARRELAHRRAHDERRHRRRSLQTGRHHPHRNAGRAFRRCRGPR
jgi:predicted CoA-binding protein/GNAT superfamily N-acetyltransferase